MGPEIPVPDSLGVDPEGRFVGVAAEDGVFYQVDLQAEVATLVAVFDSTQVDALAEICSITVAQHVSLGRLWFLWSTPCEATAGDSVLIDYDNDGLFDDFRNAAFVELLTGEYDSENLTEFY